MSNTIQTQIYSVGQTFGIPGAENIESVRNFVSMG